MRKDIDRICLTTDQVMSILDWRNDNKDAVKNFRNLFNEGVIVVTLDKHGDPIHSTVYFKVNGEQVNLEFGLEDRAIVKCIIEKQADGMLKIAVPQETEDFESYKKIVGYKDTHDFLKDNVTIYSSVMAYITFKQNEVVILEEDFLPENRLKKALRHNKYNPNRPIKIKRKVVRLNKPTYKNVTKREFTRITKSWGVIGHDRHYKSGKIVPIKPYTKGEGARKAKTYKVEVNI